MQTTKLGTFSQKTRTITASGNLDPSDNLLLVNTTGGNATVTLPNPATSELTKDGRAYRIMKTAAANTVTIAAADSVPIVGATSLTAQNQWAEVLSDGVSWYVFA